MSWSLCISPKILNAELKESGKMPNASKIKLKGVLLLCGGEIVESFRSTVKLRVLIISYLLQKTVRSGALECRDYQSTTDS